MRGLKLISIVISPLFLFVAVPTSYAQGTLLTGRVESRQEPLPLQQQKTYTYVPVPAAPLAPIAQPRPVVQKVYVKDNRSYWQRHPKVKSAAVGAGVGTAAGAVTGLISGKGVLRGSAIGAGTGAGVGLIRSSDTMKKHPIIKDVSTGALVGLGLGAAASKEKKRAFQGTGVGAAVGLGYSLFKGKLK